MNCPLCGYESKSTDVCEFSNRKFYCCEQCSLIFADRHELPSAEYEHQRYLKHQNSYDDKGYVRFLTQATNAAIPYLNISMRGLDFGCGPNPVLSQLLAERGVYCENYDPFFFPEKPEHTFDFIFSTECFEHFHLPENEINYLLSLLKENGLLIIMTSFWHEETNFSNWHYLRDKTHVSIYHFKTFEFMAKKYLLEMLFCDQKQIIVFRKN